MKIDQKERTVAVTVSARRTTARYTDTRAIIHASLAVAVGTFALVVAGTGAIVIDATTGGAVTHVGIGLTFGLVIFVMISAVGHLSGAHFNPAVTLAFAAARHFPWRRVGPYLAGQISGALLGSVLVRALFGDIAHLGATLPRGADLQSLVLEATLTFFLMFVITAVATDARAVTQTAALAIGGTVGLEALFAGPISGASMNPARSLAPALVSGTPASLWVYLVGPVLGAIAGAWAYRVISEGVPHEPAA